MEAKDTVMSDEQQMGAQFRYINEHKDLTLDFPLNGWLRDTCIKEAQAEVSFKAGYTEGQTDREIAVQQAYEAGLDKGRNAGKQEGRQEVVEFINNLIMGIDGCKFEERLDGDKGCIVLDMNEDQWGTKLKEWGIE